MSRDVRYFNLFPPAVQSLHAIALYNIQDFDVRMTCSGVKFMMPFSIFISPPGKSHRALSGIQLFLLMGLLCLTLPSCSNTGAVIDRDNADQVKQIAQWQSENEVSGSGAIATKLAVSPDGNTIASALSDGTVTLRNMVGGETIATLPASSEEILAIEFSPDGHSLFIGTHDSSVQTWDLTTSVPSLLTEQHFSTSADFMILSPDAQSFVTTNLGGGAVYLWRVAGGTLVAKLDVDNDYIDSLAFSTDGQVFAATSSDQIVQLWNTDDGSIINTIPVTVDLIKGVAVSFDGTMVAVGGLDASVEVWNVADGQPLTPRIREHNSGVTRLEFSPNGQLVASADSDTIRLSGWDAGSYHTYPPLEGHSLFIVDLQFSPNGQWLVSTSTDGTIRFWGVP